jgi:hypothetical protein
MASKKKEQIYELLTEFLEKENLYLGTAGYNPSNVAFLKKMGGKEITTDWYMEKYKEGKFYNLSYKEHFFDFVDYLLKENPKLAILELNAKKPNKNTNDWSTFFSTIMIKFENRNDFLFDFMVKESFLQDKSNFSLIETLCTKLPQQEQKEALIQMLVNMDYFQNHDYQLKIKKLCEKQLKNSDQYASYFTKLKKLDENINFDEQVEQLNTVEIVVSLDKIKNYNLEKTYSNQSLISSIQGHMEELTQSEVAKNRIGLQYASFQYNDGDVNLENKTVKFLFSLSHSDNVQEQRKDMVAFFNEYLRVKLKQEFIKFNSFPEEEIKALASTVLYKKLDSQLDEHDEAEPQKMKI